MKNHLSIRFLGFFVLAFLLTCDLFAAHVMRVHDFFTKRLRETTVPYAEILKNRDELMALYVALQNISEEEAAKIVDTLRINFSTQKVIIIVGEKGTVINRENISTSYSDNILKVSVEMMPLDKLDEEEREIQQSRAILGYPVLILATDPNAGVLIGRIAKIICCLKGFPCDETNNIGSWIRR